jgi:hypothetical protein
MEEHENLYDKIREILGGSPGKLKILEQQIDMDLQMEYYECSRKQRNKVDEKKAMERARYLFEPDFPDDVKKDILARLASIEDVDCYRKIEKFARSAPPDLQDWALLAQNESRMLLESKLLGENQVFISTGLGGRESKLRYFVVLISRNNLPITSVQQKVIYNEFDFILKKYDAELEDLGFSEYLATLLLLIPVEHSLKMVFQEAIEECNQYGDFLKEDFIVTNVKTLSFGEIKEFLEKKPGND